MAPGYLHLPRRSTTAKTTTPPNRNGQGGKVEQLFADLGKPSDAIRIDNFPAGWLRARMATFGRTQQMMELEGWMASPQQ
jgi:hypothetical protein